MGRWRKTGLVFSPVRIEPWMHSHASNPVAQPLDDGGNLLIYFTCRDDERRGHVAALSALLAGDAIAVREVHRDPLLTPGPRGAFDDSGTSVGCVVEHAGETRLYYLGWNLGITVPWRNAIGLAVRSPAERTFRRFSPAPVVDRAACDPFTLSYPWVLREEGRWRMWYGSHLRWGASGHEMEHVIKYAESGDGITWVRNGAVCIGPANPDEYAFSRPCVLRHRGLYKMWYSFRGRAYRIGYAESTDGLHWQRRDDVAGLRPSDAGWDSTMVEYAHVFEYEGVLHMLYNGNDFGRTGFGHAVFEE